MNVVMNEKQCKIINAYFRGASIFLPMLVLIIGLVLALAGFGMGQVVLGIIGLVLVVVGIIWAAIIKKNEKTKGKEEVDAAIADIREQVKAAGVEFLNLDPAEISGVEPLVVVSPGAENHIIDMTNGMPTRVGFFKSISNSIKALLKRISGGKNNSLAHVQIEKLGDDFKLRYALDEFTVYYFGEKQIYAYSVSVDITAGYTYACNMHEIFYSDICGIELLGTKRELLANKSGCMNKLVHRPVMFRTFVLYASGCSISKTVLEYEQDVSFNVELQGMRSLIRERKTAN